MRKLIFLALAAMMCAACHRQAKVPEESVQTLCEYLVRMYPQATLQDVYKTCYQDFFGAEHLMRDTAAAHKYLQYELNELRNEGMNELGMPMREPTGFRHPHHRSRHRAYRRSLYLTSRYTSYLLALRTEHTHYT